MTASDIPTKVLLEALPIPLLILDNSLRILAANTFFYQTFLLDPQDVENHLIEEFIGGARSLVESAVASDAPLTFESKLTFLRNGYKTILLHAQPVVSDGITSPIVVLTFEEISQRKRTEEIRDRLAALVETSEDAIVSKTFDGTIVTWNSAASRLFGYSEAEAVGQSIYILFPPELISEELELLGRVRRGEQISDYETIRLRKDGQRINVAITVSPIQDADGQVIGISKIAREITRRKREEARLRRLLDSAPDAMVIVNGEGRIVLINAQTQNMFGYTSEELIEQSVEILIPQRYHSVHLKHRMGYFTDPRIRAMGAGLELFAVRRDGTEFPVEISLSPLEMEDGILISSAIRDVTERKAMDELRAELEREKKINELKSRFVSMISHEIRTPLAGIQTSAELVQLGNTRMNEERKTYHLTRIQEHVKHLTYLLDDILTLSKAQTIGLEFNPVLFDVEPFCRQVIKTMPSNGQDDRITLSVEGASGREISADPKLLAQALTNLLSNALKYSGTQTTVWFDVTCKDQSAIFRVRDEGIGIPADELKQLFQLFHRASNVGAIQGTGLGLAIVKEVMEVHKGTVAVESQIGVGTTFVLTLPLS